MSVSEWVVVHSILGSSLALLSESGPYYLLERDWSSFSLLTFIEDTYSAICLLRFFCFLPYSFLTLKFCLSVVSISALFRHFTVTLPLLAKLDLFEADLSMVSLNGETMLSFFDYSFLEDRAGDLFKDVKLTSALLNRAPRSMLAHGFCFVCGREVILDWVESELEAVGSSDVRWVIWKQSSISSLQFDFESALSMLSITLIKESLAKPFLVSRTFLALSEPWTKHFVFF